MGKREWEKLLDGHLWFLNTTTKDEHYIHYDGYKKQWCLVRKNRFLEYDYVFKTFDNDTPLRSPPNRDAPRRPPPVMDLTYYYVPQPGPALRRREARPNNALKCQIQDCTT